MKVQCSHTTATTAPCRIITYIHCGKCLTEWKERFQGIMAPKDYARTQAGLTPDGVQVWCTRHDVNITDMVFKAVRS